MGTHSPQYGQFRQIFLNYDTYKLENADLKIGKSGPKLFQCANSHKFPNEIFKTQYKSI